MLMTRLSSFWQLKFLLLVLVIISISYNLLLTEFLIEADAQQQDPTVYNKGNEITTNLESPLLTKMPYQWPFIILGIATRSKKMENTIRQTYLSTTNNNSQHAFSNPCPFVGSKNYSTTNCKVLYKFVNDENQEDAINWWDDVVIDSQFDNGDPLILWTTDQTMLYPPTLERLLNQLGDSSPSSSSNSRERIFYASTKERDCRRIRPRFDQRVCTKLTGTLIAVPLNVLKQTRSCWSGSKNNEEKNRHNLNDDCLKRHNIPVLDLPRQLHQPDADSFLNEWNNWLMRWNDLPGRLVYITAKFGQDNKFRNQVERTRVALLSLGLDARQIYAYYQFPDFILNDPMWKLHLEFLDDTVIPPVRPRGGGYWFWKAPLMLHHMDKVRDGDFIVYANINSKDQNKVLIDLIHFMERTNTSLALNQAEYLERRYVKRDVYHYYCGINQDPANDQSRQYKSRFIVVRKTQGSQEFLEDWQNDLARYQMLNDSPSKMEDVEDFDHHFNEQSFLSLLLKCRHSGTYKERLVFETDNNATTKVGPIHTFHL